MNIVQRWIWGLLGYKCCLPVHHHELKGILEDYYNKVKKNQDDARATMFEYLRKMEEDKSQEPLEVRLVK